ncbi:MAG: DNA-binding protein AraC-type [Steroidobacteraceae bacterium]|nr:DNA-binding protein AraC-type [Steroidobacteraceae bacterium]
MSRVADRVRGVLRPVAEGGKLRHERTAACDALAGVVQHFWSVRWDLRGAKPFVPETLPHPNVHMVFEDDGANIAGVHTGRFTTQLKDTGWVFGVKFRPGAFRPHLGRSVATLRVSHIVDEIAENREIVSVEQVVERARLGKRTLQQLFNSYVGVGPKWVINRYRLHEAVERLQSGAQIDFTELAMELGYFDQAHFIRDFRKLVGCTPAAYTRRHPAGL